MRSVNVRTISQVKVSRQVSPFLQATKALRVSRGIALLFLGPQHQTGWGSAPHFGRLYPRKRAGTHCTGGWVGPRVGLDRCGKPRPHRDSIPGTSTPQPVAMKGCSPTQMYLIEDSGSDAIFFSARSVSDSQPRLFLVLVTSSCAFPTAHP